MALEIGNLGDGDHLFNHVAIKVLEHLCTGRQFVEQTFVEHDLSSFWLSSKTGDETIGGKHLFILYLRYFVNKRAPIPGTLLLNHFFKLFNPSLCSRFRYNSFLKFSTMGTGLGSILYFSARYREVQSASSILENISCQRF